MRWRCQDIQARIAREWGVALRKRSVGKSGKALALPRLHRLRFARVSTRPRLPGNAGLLRLPPCSPEPNPQEPDAKRQSEEASV